MSSPDHQPQRSESTRRRRPPGHVHLRSLERLGFDTDDEDRPPETPPYRRNMSQLTLPPEYLSDGHHEEDDEGAPPMPRNAAAVASSSRNDEKRRETEHDDTSRPRLPELTLQSSEDATPHHLDGSNDNSPDSQTSRSQVHFTSPRSGEPGGGHRQVDLGDTSGDTLVNSHRAFAKGAGVHYPDEHGGLLHSVPSPGYPDPKIKGSDVGRLQRRGSIDSSRAASVVDTDGDGDSEADETYNWSDEDDLVDQEAHFEAKLNARTTKKKSWGIRRCVSSHLSAFSTLHPSEVPF